MKRSRKPSERAAGALAASTGPKWNLVRVAFDGNAIHWLDGFILFEKWRTGRQERSYLTNFGVWVSRAKTTITEELGISGADFTRTKRGPTWRLEIPRGAALPVEYTEALHLSRKALGAFEDGRPEGWALLLEANATWPHTRRLCQAILASSLVAPGPSESNSVRRISEVLREHKEALLSAIIKVSFLAQARRQGVDPAVADPVLRGWLREVAEVAEIAASMPSKDAPVPPTDPLAEKFARRAESYAELELSLRDALETGDPSCHVTRSDRDRILGELCQSEFVTRGLERVTREFEAHRHWRISATDVTECLVPAVGDFLRSTDWSARRSSGLATRFERQLRIEVERSRAERGLADRSLPSELVPSSVKSHFRSLLASFETPARIDSLVQKMFDTIPGAQWQPAGEQEDSGLDRPRHFYDVFREIFERHRMCGGRHDELERLNQFVQDPEGGYLLVTGTSGYGKTSLLARFAEHLERASIPAAVHFISPRVHDASQRFCLSNLCKQLSAIHGISTDLPRDEWDLLALYCQLIQMEPPPGRSVAVLIDGLDEALGTWRPGPAMFPPGLPAGVHVAFSARTMADTNWLSRLGLQLPEERIISLEKLSKEDVAEALLQSKIFPEDAEEPEDAAQVLFTLSNGDPYYLHDLLADLRESGGDLEGLRDYPIGHSAYLVKWWKEGGAACREHGGAFGDLMTYLALAHGPLVRDVLIHLSEKDALWGHNFRTLIEQAGRHIEGNDNCGYTLSHRRIVDFVLKETSDKVDICRGRLAEFCRRWKRASAGPARDYTLRFGPAHLAETGQAEALRALLFDFDWLRAKIEVTGPAAILTDCDIIPADQGVSSVRDAIAQSIHPLVADPRHLPAQLLARLQHVDDPNVQRLLTQARSQVTGTWLRPCSRSLPSPAGPIAGTLRGHTDGVSALAIAPDGKHAVSGSCFGTLLVWDLERRSCLYELRGHDRRITDIAVRQGGRRIITAADDGTIRAWHLHEVKTQHVYDWRSGTLWTAAPLLADDSANDMWPTSVTSLRSPDVDVPRESEAWPTCPALAISARADQVACAARRATLSIWSVDRGILLHAPVDVPGDISTIAWSPDGSHVVAGSSTGALCIWARHSNSLRTLQGPNDDRVLFTAVTASGSTIVSGSASGVFRFWDLLSGEALAELVVPGTHIAHVDVTPCAGRIIAATSMGYLHVLDTAAGRTRCVGRDPSCDITHETILHSSRRRTVTVRYSYSRFARLNEEIQRLYARGEWCGITSLAIAADGRSAVTGSWDGSVRSWELDDGHVQATVDAHDDAVTAVAVSANHRQAVSGGSDGQIRMLRVDVGQNLCKSPSLRATLVALTPDSRHALIHCDTGVCVYDVANGTELQSLQQSPVQVFSTIVGPDVNHVIMGGQAGDLRVWDVATGRVSGTLTGHSTDVYALAATHDGRRVISGECNGTVIIWDLESRGRIHVMKGHERVVDALAVTRDGRRVVSWGRDEGPRTWDLESGMEIRAPRRARKGRTGVGWDRGTWWAPSLHRHTVDGPGLVEKVYSIEEWGTRGSLKGAAPWVESIQMMPDDRRAVACRVNGAIHIVDVESARITQTYEGHADHLGTVAVAADCGRAAQRDRGGSLCLYELEEGSVRVLAAADRGVVSAVCMAQDGTLVIAGGLDGMIRVWDADRGEVIAEFMSEGCVSSIGVASDGRSIVACEESGRIHFLRLEGVK